MSKKIISVFCLLFLLVPLAGCQNASNVSDNIPRENQKNISGQSNDITVIGKEFSFAPSQLSFKKGDNVSIKFINEGQYPHNLTIDGLGLSTATIPAGEETEISFTADETGKYDIYCSVAGHRDAGMEGTLAIQ